MGLPDCAAMRGEFLRRGVAGENTRWVITHFSHNGAPLSENLRRAEEEYSVEAARDGFSVEI